jgi:hypothetical protein
MPNMSKTSRINKKIGDNNKLATPIRVQKEAAVYKLIFVNKLKSACVGWILTVCWPNSTGVSKLGLPCNFTKLKTYFFGIFLELCFCFRAK